MKAFIVLAVACFVACASASHLGGYASAGAAIASTGSSSQFREEDSYGNYKFGYDESHASGRTARREERNGDVVHGSYSLADADGRDRTVHYVADASGFRATIHTNEPGVDASRDPAAVLINKEGFAAAPAPEQVAFAAAPSFRPLAGPVAYGPAPAAPAPFPAQLPAAPVFATKSYAAPSFAAPAPAPAPAPVAFESNQRQAFSYSFGTSHPSFAPAPAPVFAPAPAPVYASAPLAPAAPAPIFQQGIKY